MATDHQRGNRCLTERVCGMADDTRLPEDLTCGDCQWWEPNGPGERGGECQEYFQFATRYADDPACEPVVQMWAAQNLLKAAEFRLQEEQKSLALYWDLTKRYGYDPDAEDPWTWLETQLAERRVALHRVGMLKESAKRAEQERDEARVEIADLKEENFALQSQLALADRRNS